MLRKVLFVACLPLLPVIAVVAFVRALIEWVQDQPWGGEP